MTSVDELFEHAGVAGGGVVRWGQAPSLATPGVYIVSTSDDPKAREGLPLPPLDTAAIAVLIAARPEATVDGVAATALAIEHRLRAMWPAGEPATYIGLAGTSVESRVRQYYGTKIGARAPHAGGWPIKMLDASQLWVHFGATSDPDVAERVMIERFGAGLPGDVRSNLIDPGRPLPFANLTLPRGARKAHGFSGVKAPKAPSVNSLHGLSHQPVAQRATVDAAPIAVAVGGGSTQNVTPVDLKSGQLRIPRVSKRFFPRAKGRLVVNLAGHECEAFWDPRNGGDRERSGVLRFPRAVFVRVVVAGGPLPISATTEGLRIL